MQSLALRVVHPSTIAARDWRERRDGRDEVRSTLLTSRPSRESRVSRVVLGRAAGRSLSADRSPTSLGVHEGSFEALAFFAELQTIFLDPAIDFPP